jgi:hypothetical protein
MAGKTCSHHGQEAKEKGRDEGPQILFENIPAME